MRILQVASSLPGQGGIEKSVIHLATGLQARGHEVDIAAIPGSWVQKQAQARNLSTLDLTVRKQYDLSALLPSVRLLRRQRYDIINVHFSPDYIVPALAARLTKQPSVVMTRYHVKAWRGSKRWMYSQGLGYRKIIGVSHAVRNALIAGGFAEDSVEVIHGGVPIQSLNSVLPATEFASQPNTVQIGIVARIAPEKGHFLLMEAMRHVDKNVVCLVVGDGQNKAKVENFVQANGLQEQVRFLGWRTDSDAITAALDAVIQPSLWEEACSLSIMEAMALGKPPVVTEAGGNSELVLHERTGLVVPKTDPMALSDAINTLARSPELRLTYGEASRQRQQECFSIETMVEKTEQLYSRLCRTARR